MSTYFVDGSFYSKKRGYGIVNQADVAGNTKAEQSLNNGGWNHRESDGEGYKTAYEMWENGTAVIGDRQVLVFRCDVKDFGTYKINLEFIADNDITGMKIWSGRRNLVRDSFDLKKGQKYETSFYVNVTPYIPALSSVPMMDKTIFISVSGMHAQLGKIEILKEDVPVIWIAGDSTLTDQNAGFPYYPYGSCTGWAQILECFAINVAVSNHAHSGLTTNCFKDDGHFDLIKDRIKPGDIFIIQFGHNDQKRRNLAAFGGYINNLRWYIKEIRKRGAYPIIVSPISRIPLEDRRKSLLSAHAEACRDVSLELDVPFINLHKMTLTKWCEIGDEARDYFMPGDITHTNEYGARVAAQFIVDDIFEQHIEVIEKNISKRFVVISPESDTKELPKEPADAGPFNMKMPYVDVEGCAKYDELQKGFEYGLFDPCVMHLHPYDYMPRAQLLMVLFKALKVSGTRPYFGKFVDIDRFEWDSAFVQTCINKGILDSETMESDFFRPNDALTYDEFAAFVIGGINAVKGSTLCISKTVLQDNNVHYVDRQHSFEEAVNRGIIDGDCKAGAVITRQDCYAGLVRLMELLGVQNEALPGDVEAHPVG